MGRATIDDDDDDDLAGMGAQAQAQRAGEVVRPRAWAATGGCGLGGGPGGGRGEMLLVCVVQIWAGLATGLLLLAVQIGDPGPRCSWPGRLPVWQPGLTRAWRDDDRAGTCLGGRRHWGRSMLARRCCRLAAGDDVRATGPGMSDAVRAPKSDDGIRAAVPMRTMRVGARATSG